MTLAEIVTILEGTGRVMDIARTSPTGLILPDGRILSVRNVDPSETHDDVLLKLELSKQDLLTRFGFVRKISGNYQFDFANRSAKALIETDILRSARLPTDVIYISNMLNGRFDYSITYQDFLTAGSILPNTRLRETYF